MATLISVVNEMVVLGDCPTSGLEITSPFGRTAGTF